MTTSEWATEGHAGRSLGAGSRLAAAPGRGGGRVVGAVLTTMLAMVFGFQTVLWLALLVYGVAMLALWGLVRNGPDGASAAPHVAAAGIGTTG